MRTVLAALALLLAAFGLAQSGGSFASLVITSAGDEEFDIATGVTTLLEGGEIRDQGSGIVLTAPWISYKVDEYIETRDTTVTGSFGRVTGETVHVDIPSSKLTASGSLQLAGRNLLVSGDTLEYFAEAGVIDLTGNVVATDPVFSASRVLYHTASGTVLLFGPYSFDDGFMRLDASSSDSRLELRRPEEEPESEDAFYFLVSSTPDPSTLQLFANWLD